VAFSRPLHLIRQVPFDLLIRQRRKACLLSGMLNRHGNQIAGSIEIDANIFIYLFGFSNFAVRKLN